MIKLSSVLGMGSASNEGKKTVIQNDLFQAEFYPAKNKTNWIPEDLDDMDAINVDIRALHSRRLDSNEIYYSNINNETTKNRYNHGELKIFDFMLPYLPFERALTFWNVPKDVVWQVVNIIRGNQTINVPSVDSTSKTSSTSMTQAPNEPCATCGARYVDNSRWSKFGNQVRCWQHCF